MQRKRYSISLGIDQRLILIMKDVAVGYFNLTFCVRLVINTGKSMIRFLRLRRKEEVKDYLLVSAIDGQSKTDFIEL